MAVSPLNEKFTVARFVDHPSFQETNATTLYRDRARVSRKEQPSASHLADEATRELAKGMHYAACTLVRGDHGHAGRPRNSRRSSPSIGLSDWAA